MFVSLINLSQFIKYKVTSFILEIKEMLRICTNILDKTFVDFHFLAQFVFTTSETEQNYYH